MMTRVKIKSRINTSNLSLHLMIWPALLIVIIFAYGPMFGLVMAFQEFSPIQGWFRSEWVGLANFKEMFILPNFFQVIKNTFFISLMEILLGQMMAIVVTLMLDQARNKSIRRTIQTIIYLPHFLSWVILGGILIEILSLDGAFNQMLTSIGMEPVSFLGNPKIFPWTLIVSHVWKEFGFATIVYFAALTNIDPTLYEAAEMDGAGKLKQVWHITLPGIAPIIVLVMVLSIGTLLNNGFEQVFTLYNPVVYSTGDILDTFIYRLGLVQSRYSLAAAVGIFKSLVSTVFVSASYFIAYKVADYRIF